MSSILTAPLKINGVVSTDKTVLQNLNNLATASGCFLTYDINQGKWSVIINRPGISVDSFDDSNIVGSITLSETGVSELYNSASVEFPDPDLRDEVDYVDVIVDSSERYPNELDNNLEIQIDCINNPVQAQYLASIELKQSRLSKIITFSADYTSLGLKAGDLIDVTSNQYGFTNKVFRIIRLEESDEDVIGLSITALEYSEDVYDDSGLSRSERTRATGIQLREQNTAIQESDDVDVGNQLVRLLVANLGASLLRKLFERITGTNKFGPKETATKNIDKILTNAQAPTLNAITNSGDVCEGDTVIITVTNDESAENCQCSLIPVPTLEYDYTITGVFEEDINIPLTGTVSVDGTTHIGSLTIVTSNTAGGSSSQTMSITIGGLNTSVDIYNTPDYDYVASASSTTITEGNSTIITLDTINVDVGTSVPYTITGDTGRITSPALTGNVTINGSYQAELTINTSVTSGHTGNDTFTVTFAPALTTPCLANSVNITVNDSTPYQAPTTCEYVDVPVVWCPQYSGYDNQCQAVNVLKTARFAVANAGESTVSLPATLSVSKGNPSTITVASSVSVASSSSLGGIPIQVITEFNTVQPNGLVTGSSTTTVYGYFI